MSHRRYSDEEIARRGKQLYEQRIRPRVLTEEYIGKIVSIDIETGDYRIDSELLRAAQHLQMAQPNAAIWSERIGYNAVYALDALPKSRVIKSK